MKPDIHPSYEQKTVVCSCGNTFQTGSTYKSDTIRIDVCSACHPFYTGKYRIVDATGQVDQFMRRYGTYKKGAIEKATTEAGDDKK